MEASARKSTQAQPPSFLAVIRVPVLYFPFLLDVLAPHGTVVGLTLNFQIGIDLRIGQELCSKPYAIVCLA